MSLENISKAGVSLPLEYPLTLKLYTDADILEDTRIVTSQELTRFIPLYRLSKAGEYRLVVEDASGFSTEKRIIVEPDAPHHLATTL
ncbi:MAG: hypothetical protein H6767_06835 [Candidatus Peribacteria bacterium]|nr:MAG: hypothetical protein H6767_06835 [Candidatus Peribacteria bacterium]